MVNIEIKKVKLSQIKLNPDNPRQISKKDMKLLVKSLKEFPEMMQLREIIVDEDMMILGGNMRYRALKQSSEKECIAKIVSGLTSEQKREFIIKDNSVFGEWDMDALANAWGDLPLNEWSIELSEDWLNGKEENIKEESEYYTLMFKLLKDDAAYVQEKLHKENKDNALDEKWRERCLLKLLKKTD